MSAAQVTAVRRPRHPRVAGTAATIGIVRRPRRRVVGIVVRHRLQATVRAGTDKIVPCRSGVAQAARRAADAFYFRAPGLTPWVA